jgi:hypothetical protein
MPTAQSRGHGGYLSTIMVQVEGMQDQSKRGEVGPNGIHLGEFESAVEGQPCEHIGDLTRKHGRSMQALAGVEPVA